MATKAFEVLEKVLMDATCPEDYYGSLLVEDTEACKKIIEKKHTEYKEIAGNDPEKIKNANLSYRTSRIQDRYRFLTLWALEKIENKTYGDKLDYRAKIRLSVKEYEGKILFFVEDVKEKKVYINSLCAVHFDGYDRQDTVSILRGGKEVCAGTVVYHGTHAASEFFSFSEEQNSCPPNLRLHGLVYDLVSEDFMVGDIIEIKVWRYASAEEFANMLIGFNNVGKSLTEAFQNSENGILEGKELPKIGQQARKKTEKDIKEKNVFVLIKE